ncbi:META domain-containing protein [Nocardia sp. SYP-A9097]|uniref:META domain-containing protein n=1 Tax=Nocardia sp. SYP-A9097 TaxID=2663237 RepID=UPI00129B74D0|nr:META domain-containing protein [Nocardia sp. SYP-A9097]MRH87448.1 META domain-containing protein [Nocardia sp. SYP-A9097]
MSATRRWCVLLAVTVGAVAGCTNSQQASDQPTATPMGRSFVSSEVKGTAIPGGGPLTMQFRDGRVTASAGCNTATGPVTLDGGILKVGEMATTLMGCPGETAGADDWALGLLRSSPAWKLTGPDLTLTGNGSTVTMLDRKVAHPDKPLTGTPWIVDSLVRNNAVERSQILDEVRPTLTIAPDGSISGSAGCNTMTGRAEISGSDITFHIATTRMMCDPQVMDVERAVLQALDGKATATIDSNNLSLQNTGNGTGLRLHAE